VSVKNNLYASLRCRAAAFFSALLLCACASVSSVDVNRKAPLRAYQVVNVICGPDQAGDVSAALEAALKQRGFKTRINPATPGVGTLTARFQDTWKRNGMTYLGRLNLEFLDVDSKTLLVSSTWENTGGRQAQSVPEVVDQLVATMIGRAPQQLAQPQQPTQIVRDER
jgi:hypothetical protein